MTFTEIVDAAGRIAEQAKRDRENVMVSIMAYGSPVALIRYEISIDGRARYGNNADEVLVQFASMLNVPTKNEAKQRAELLGEIA